MLEALNHLEAANDFSFPKFDSCLVGVFLVKYWLCFLLSQPHPSQEDSHAGDLFAHPVTAAATPFLFWRSEWVRGEGSPALISHFSRTTMTLLSCMYCEHLTSGNPWQSSRTKNLKVLFQNETSAMWKKLLKHQWIKDQKCTWYLGEVSCDLSGQVVYHPSLWKAEKQQWLHLKSLKWQMSLLNCPADKGSLSPDNPTHWLAERATELFVTCQITCYKWEMTPLAN